MLISNNKTNVFSPMLSVITRSLLAFICDAQAEQINVNSQQSTVKM
ncbi:hypothetical protein RsY01_1883 [Lactococcus reticulitermitis]|uniref:Uncharacterized protein n=1 Tax=Pseudolactococcus reticulitermitis TaxID=2025039 RepID=A0A224X285_9LACT|nr:hypothetical protein RsY01_1883 [Lactococcus reticulitermitis]